MSLFALICGGDRGKCLCLRLFAVETGVNVSVSAYLRWRPG